MLCSHIFNSIALFSQFSLITNISSLFSEYNARRMDESALADFDNMDKDGKIFSKFKRNL